MPLNFPLCCGLLRVRERACCLRHTQATRLFDSGAFDAGWCGSGGFHCEREPQYGGKRLSQWVEALPWPVYGNNGLAENEKAEDAIRQIGTNGLPYLLEWIRYEPWAWKARFHREAYKLQHELRSRWMMVDRREDLGMGAMRAFKALGSEAERAIPTLASLLTNSTAKESPARAVGSLGFLGKDALPPLLAILTNQQQRLRMDAAAAIGCLGSNALPAVPALLQCLPDSNLLVAMIVPGILGRLKLEPDQVVPALVRNLQDSRLQVRSRAASALGEFGDKARVAVLPCSLRSATRT